MRLRKPRERETHFVVAANVKTRRKKGEVMLKDLCKYGFMQNYTRWVCHGEAYRPREEAVRQCLEAFDGDG
jgi:hypothetical protein